MAIDRRQIMASQIELGVVVRIGRVPCVVARVADRRLLRMAMEAVVAQAADSQDVAERQQAALVAELLGQMDAAVTPVM